MSIYSNKDFTLSKKEVVQFGEYPVTKNSNIGQSKYTSSNSLIPGAYVEFGEYEKTTKEIGMDSEYNPSEVDILQSTNSGDNVEDNQNVGNNDIISENLEFNDYQIIDSNTNNLDITYQTNETTENTQGLKTLYGESNNYSPIAYEFNGNTIDNGSHTYDEYQSTTKIEPLEEGFDEINFKENTPIFEESLIKKNETNLDINEYQSFEPIIELNNNIKNIETSIYESDNNYYGLNIDMNYSTKDNLTNSIPIMETNEQFDIGGFQINEQMIGTSDSIDTVQIASSTLSNDFKEDKNSWFYDSNAPIIETMSFNEANFTSSTPLQETNISSEGYEIAGPYFETSIDDNNYQANEKYGKAVTSFDDTYKDSESYIEKGTTHDEKAYQITEPYFETSTILNTIYQVSEPYVESTEIEGNQAFEPYVENEISFDNTVYQTPETEISKIIDYNNFSMNSSQVIDSNVYLSNEQNIETGKTFDEKMYRKDESYTDINKKYDDISNQFDDFEAKEAYPDITYTIEDTSSPKDKITDDISKGYKEFDYASYQLNEPYKEMYSTIDTTKYQSKDLYGETDELFKSYNVDENQDKVLNKFNSSNHLEANPLTEKNTTYDEIPFKVNEPYFETATTIDTTSYQINEKEEETINDTTYKIKEPYAATAFDDSIYKTSEPYFEALASIDNTQTSFENPKNDYQSKEQYFEVESNNIMSQENEPYFESSISNDNKVYQISDLYGEYATKISDIDYQSIKPYTKGNIGLEVNEYQKAGSHIETKPSFNISNSKKNTSKLNVNIISTFDFNKYTNIESGIDTTSTLETTDYLTNSQNFDISYLSSTLKKEKNSKTASYESRKAIGLETFETNEYPGNEIYDMTDNFITSEYKKFSLNIEPISKFSEKKIDKTSNLQYLDNKTNDTIGTYHITEPIESNFNYNDAMTSKPRFEKSPYQELKPSLETISTIEATTSTTSTPPFEKYNPSFDFNALGIEIPTTENTSLKAKEPITKETTFETNPEFDFTSYITSKPFDKIEKNNQRAISSDVKITNISPEYKSKTYKVKNQSVKTGIDNQNIGAIYNYDLGAGYNMYKTATSKKSQQKIENDLAFPTKYTIIKTSSKPVKTSTTTTFLQNTPSYDTYGIYKDYQTIQNLKTTTFPKKKIVTSVVTVPTKTEIKTEYLLGPKISSHSKPVNIISYTKPKIESPPIPDILPNPIIPSLLETGETFGELIHSKKEKNTQSAYSPTYTQTFIKSSSPISLVPQPKVSMVPPISLVPPISMVPKPKIIKKIKKLEPIIIKIPKIQKVYVPKKKKVYIPNKKKIYINKPSSSASFNQQISYIPKPSLSVTKNSSIISNVPKTLSIVPLSSTYNYIENTIPVKSYSPFPALSTYPLKNYSEHKILKYNQNVISQIPNMNGIIPIQPSSQIPSNKYSNRTYVTPNYTLSNIYSGSSVNSSKSKNILNFIGNKYASRTYQARKL